MKINFSAIAPLLRGTGHRRLWWIALGVSLALAGLAWTLESAQAPATGTTTPAVALPQPTVPAAVPARAVQSAPENLPSDLSDSDSGTPVDAAVSVPAGDSVVADNQADLAGEQTLYLTIVGNKIYRMMGPVSGRPPRIDELGLAGMQPVRTAPDRNQQANVRPGAGYVIADQEQPAVTLGPDERPLGPAPQECPRTLPPGSTQETADGLRRQAGCRYLGSCEVGSNDCTFYYQGRD